MLIRPVFEVKTFLSIATMVFAAIFKNEGADFHASHKP
jgi:hypothetical protein